MFNLEEDAVKVIGIPAVLAVAFGMVFWFGTMHGETKKELADNKIADGLRAQITKLSKERQAALDKAAAIAMALAASNQERSNAIDTASKQKKQLSEADQELQVINKKLGIANVHAADFDTFVRVYHDAVHSCKGLPDADSAFLVPRAVQKSPTQSIAEAIKRLVGDRCGIAVNYNALHKSYLSSTNRVTK